MSVPVSEEFNFANQENYTINGKPCTKDSQPHEIELNSSCRVDEHHAERPISLPPLNTSAHNALPRFSALSSVSLSSPDHGPSSITDHSTSLKSPQNALSPAQPVLDSWREWSISTFKFARQVVSERLGHSEKTVDAALEAHITCLRELQAKYTNLLNLALALMANFHHSLTTQRKLSDSFSELALMNGELCEAFTRNADTQKVLVRNGDNLLRALNTFTATLNTLCNKTFSDTLSTVKQYEASRIEYDAYRLDLETLSKGPRDAVSMKKISEAETRYQVYKEKYERLRADVDIKMKFLDENRVKVMHKQLLMFHSAVSSYFCGNQLGLDETLKKFSICTSIPRS